MYGTPLAVLLCALCCTGLSSGWSVASNGSGAWTRRDLAWRRLGPQAIASWAPVTLAVTPAPLAPESLRKRHEDEDEEDEDEEEEDSQDLEEDEESYEGHGSTTQRSHHKRPAHKRRRKNKNKKGKAGIKVKGLKKLKKYLLPMLLAYKLKFALLIPVLLGGMFLLMGTTAFAGFFFALFTVGLGLKKE